MRAEGMCSHNLVMCQNCHNVWDGNAQCDCVLYLDENKSDNNTEQSEHYELSSDNKDNEEKKDLSHGNDVLYVEISSDEEEKTNDLSCDDILFINTNNSQGL